MKKIPVSVRIIATVVAVAIGASARIARANFNEPIIWDPNGNLGSFTDLTSNFITILVQLGNPAPTIFVSGGSTALQMALASAPSGSVIEVTDSQTYAGGLVITDKTDIVIRAAFGASPVIDCGTLGLGGTCLNLIATAVGSVNNIGIKGLTFKNIRFSHGGSAATGQGIASFSAHILKNIVIEDNTFDNSDPTKDQSYKGSAIHLNKVDGLLIRRNTIINGALHSSTSTQEDAAITIHEFLVQPNYLDNVFIQNNHIWFDYAAISPPGAVSANIRGIVLAHTGWPLQRFNNVVVEYNLIDNVQKEGIKIFGMSSDLTDDQTVTVRNTVIKRTDDGIEMDGGTLLVDRTIFDGLTSFAQEGKDEGIDWDAGVTTTVSNSIVINKVKGVTGGGVTIYCVDLFNPVVPHPTSSVGGTISNADPMFVNTSINDYRIGNPSFPGGCMGGNFGVELILPELQVEIDIKPGSYPNSIKLSNKGVVPVVILTTPSFDATMVDASTVCFGDAEDATQRDCTEAHATGHIKDVDRDGDLDLLLHYETKQTGIDIGDTQACLTGMTFGGTPIQGCDSVRTLDP